MGLPSAVVLVLRETVTQVTLLTGTNFSGNFLRSSRFRRKISPSSVTTSGNFGPVWDWTAAFSNSIGFAGPLIYSHLIPSLLYKSTLRGSSIVAFCVDFQLPWVVARWD